MTGLAVAGLVGLSLPASAHHADITGSTVCANGAHVVQWSFTNSQSNMVMTIDSATAAIGATPYSITGYTSPVANSGSTSATSTVPGNVTGTIKATLDVSWPDNYKVTSTGEVNIPQSCTTTTTASTTSQPTTTTTEVTTTTAHQCGCETTTTMPPTTTTTVEHHCGCTTTTTMPPTTTTAATTTTGATTTTAATTTSQPTTTTGATTTTISEQGSTVPTTTTSITEVLGSTTIVTNTTQPKTTTSLGEQGSTVPTIDTTTSVPVGTVNLPRTGGNFDFPVLFGGLCILAGAALALRKRSDWSRS